MALAFTFLELIFFWAKRRERPEEWTCLFGGIPVRTAT